MSPSAWLACGLALAATATPVSGQGSWSGGATPQPRHDSRQQREDSIEADRARKSGAMSTQPSTPSASQGRAASSAPDVGRIQAALKARGHDPGPVDGVIGVRTQEALRAYQVSQGLKATGETDAETVEKLGLARSSRQP